jgi:lactate dehydrogenase-like 2-hydroxyacid dehydrogenase
MAKGKNLKAISRTGVGVDSVDVAAATKRKIRF